MRGHARKSVLALTQYDGFALVVLIYDSRGARNIRWPRSHCEADLVSDLPVPGRGSWLRTAICILDRHEVPRYEPQSHNEKKNCTSVHSARIPTNPGEHGVINLFSKDDSSTGRVFNPGNYWKNLAFDSLGTDDSTKPRSLFSRRPRNPAE